MHFSKKNKNLLLWILIAALGVAFAFYASPDVNYIDKETKNDSTFYFSFNNSQKKQLYKLFTNLNKKHSFNGVSLIGQRDSVFFSGAYGYSNYATRDSITLQSSFQLASVSKQFTAVAILQLYEKGLLHLTDTIQRFYTEFPYKDITIHQLLTHRSGLPNYHYFLQHIPTTADTTISNIDLVNEMILKKPRAYYAPNRRYHYSNTGYAILAAIVEKVSGLSFQEYLKTNIFDPLSMYNSYAYRGTENENIDLSNKTTGYLKRWRKAEDNYLDGVLGDKGVYCSAEDLFKWDQGLYKNKIISTDTLQLAFKPMGKPQYFKSNYGYGWRMFNWGNDTTKVLYHAGWWHGYKTLIIRIPKDTTSIIILNNRSSGLQVKTKTLLNILYPKNVVKCDSVEHDSTQLVSILM